MEKLLILSIVVGILFYLHKQWKEQDEFDLIKFLFGTVTCDNIHYKFNKKNII